MTKDRALQLPGSTENRIKIYIAPNSVFIFPYRVSMPAGGPQRRSTAGASRRNRLAACRVFRPLTQWFKERTQHEAEACKRRRFDLASRGVSGQGKSYAKLTKKEFLTPDSITRHPCPQKHSILHWALFDLGQSEMTIGTCHATSRVAAQVIHSHAAVCCLSRLRVMNDSRGSVNPPG